jgi:pimeloyl-ACP methyl ester carboxylesterase
MDDLAADAAAALDFLRAHPGVRAGAAGLFGHSEGGWVVLRAASARGDVPWVVTSSCPGVTPAVQETVRAGQPPAAGRRDQAAGHSRRAGRLRSPR